LPTDNSDTDDTDDITDTKHAYGDDFAATADIKCTVKVTKMKNFVTEGNPLGRSFGNSLSYSRRQNHVVTTASTASTATFRIFSTF